jgi:hypothetical protein
LDRNNLGVGAEVGIRREDLPSASNRDCANQEIIRGSCHASSTALVTPMRRLFVVSSGESFIRKCPQTVAQAFELPGFPYAGEQFLSNRSDEPRAAILNEISQ